jgi:hypothetical protein
MLFTRSDVAESLPVGGSVDGGSAKLEGGEAMASIHKLQIAGQ